MTDKVPTRQAALDEHHAKRRYGLDFFGGQWDFLQGYGKLLMVWRLSHCRARDRSNIKTGSTFCFMWKLDLERSTSTLWDEVWRMRVHILLFTYQFSSHFHQLSRSEMETNTQKDHHTIYSRDWKTSVILQFYKLAQTPPQKRLQQFVV